MDLLWVCQVQDFVVFFYLPSGSFFKVKKKCEDDPSGVFAKSDPIALDLAQAELRNAHQF
jgi:hypothetical protein